MKSDIGGESGPVSEEISEDDYLPFALKWEDIRYSEAWLFVLRLKWVYVQNSNMWYWMDKEYTDYYDIEGKRILGAPHFCMLDV